jgi:hypothetical protein
MNIIYDENQFENEFKKYKSEIDKISQKNKLN